MFIPKTAPLYENLATSFVVIDALVEDLCEGGFTGVIEIVFRDSDCRIVIGRGGVLATTESRAERAISLSNPAQIAAKSKSERGRLSVYKLSDDTAEAIAKRMLAGPLYSGLSTEFADPEKMISKLRREVEREWFIEIATESGLTGLIHLKGGRLHAVASESERQEGDESAGRLFEECKTSGGSFDVYYSLAGSAAIPWPPPAATEPDIGPTSKEPVAGREAGITDQPPEVKAISHAAHTNGEAPVVATAASLSTEEPHSVAGSDSANSAPIPPPPTIQPVPPVDQATVAAASTLANSPEIAVPTGDDRQYIRKGVPLGTGELAEGETMIEVKRLMAEIASSIESTTRQVENRSTFSMYLRAGQLKIADRYPFLDPFGSEFEYHAGEIAFIGKDKPEVFIEGVTEALRLAVIGVIEASTAPDRLRSQIQEDLYGLSERKGSELGDYGLENCIGQIIG
jgi:hypothetical protein